MYKTSDDIASNLVEQYTTEQDKRISSSVWMGSRIKYIGGQSRYEDCMCEGEKDRNSGGRKENSKKTS
jgi:hypothetical protein